MIWLSDRADRAPMTESGMPISVNSTPCSLMQNAASRAGSPQASVMIVTVGWAPPETCHGRSWQTAMGNDKVRGRAPVPPCRDPGARRESTTGDTA